MSPKKKKWNFEDKEHPLWDKNPELKLDAVNELKLFFLEEFGDSTWIPRSGISKAGNVYITVILKAKQGLDSWYVKRKGLEP